MKNFEIISKEIHEVPHVHKFTKNDFVAYWHGHPKLEHDPFPGKKPDDVIREEIIARKRILRAKISGEVIDVRPGTAIDVDGYTFSVTSAKIDLLGGKSEIEGLLWMTKPEPLRLLEVLRNNEISQHNELLYRADPPASLVIADISKEVKAYLARHPEKTRDLTPRQFEELIADILKDFGFTTELTKATRDGGWDIYAYVKNAVTSCMMFVECKKWSETNKVGIDVVQRLYGAAKGNRADKSMIVTTSFFTSPASKEREKYAAEMELKDYNDLKEWLSRYKNE
jgi:HJR/Mrr/RecB family endonuclease